MHHCAGNYQFVFHTFFLASDTDKSTFTTGRAHYGQLIRVFVSFPLNHFKVVQQSEMCKNMKPVQNNFAQVSYFEHTMLL